MCVLGSEYWITLQQPQGYPSVALSIGELPKTTKQGTAVAVELRSVLENIAQEAASLGVGYFPHKDAFCTFPIRNDVPLFPHFLHFPHIFP